MIFVSPAEQQRELKALGESARWVEDYGVDYAWFIDGKPAGIQRKEVKDLVASTMSDDRLAKELHQMKELAIAVLLVEGSWDWTRDGKSLRCKNYTRAQYTGLRMSVQVEHGVHIIETGSLAETVDTIPRVYTWTVKESHGSLLARSAAPKGSIRDAEVWALQGFGFGRKTAENVCEHFGGVPLTPTCSLDELLSVPGVGKKRAAEFLKRFAYTEEGS